MKKKFIGVIAAAAMLFGVTGCNQEVQSSMIRGVVSGVVVKVGDKAPSVAGSNGYSIVPVEGATVRLGGRYSATTDANGVWIVENVEAGSYDVVVAKEGCVSYFGQGNVTVNGAGYLGADPDGFNIIKEMYKEVLDEANGNYGSRSAVDVDAGNFENVDNDDTIDAAVAGLLTLQKKLNFSAYAVAAAPAVVVPLSGTITGTVGIKAASGDKTSDVLAERVIPGSGIKVVAEWKGHDGIWKQEVNADNDGKFKFENVPADVAIYVYVQGGKYEYYKETPATTDGAEPIWSYVVEKGEATPITGDAIKVGDEKSIDLDSSDNGVGVKYAITLVPIEFVDVETSAGEKNKIARDASVTVTFTEPIYSTKVDVVSYNSSGKNMLDYDVSEDGKTITVNLKQGYLWSNNTKITLSNVEAVSGKKIWYESDMGKNPSLDIFVYTKKAFAIDLVEVIKAADIPATAKARVVATKYDALKITFNDEIASVKDIKVNNKYADAKFEGKVLYIPLANVDIGVNSNIIDGTVYGAGENEVNSKGFNLSTGLAGVGAEPYFNSVEVEQNGIVETSMPIDSSSGDYVVTLTFAEEFPEGATAVISSSLPKHSIDVSKKIVTITFEAGLTTDIVIPLQIVNKDKVLIYDIAKSYADEYDFEQDLIGTDANGAKGLKIVVN